MLIKKFAPDVILELASINDYPIDKKNIARLLQIAWWDWDIEKINAKLPDTS